MKNKLPENTEKIFFSFQGHFLNIVKTPINRMNKINKKIKTRTSSTIFKPKI